MKSILVVDDTPGLLSLLAATLRGAEYLSIQASSAEEAIKALASMPHIDALITDILMPGMNGFELARRLRGEFADLPILFISGFFDSATEDYLAWLKDPRSAFLLKPFEPTTLLAELENVLRI